MIGENLSIAEFQLMKSQVKQILPCVTRIECKTHDEERDRYEVIESNLGSALSILYMNLGDEAIHWLKKESDDPEYIDYIWVKYSRPQLKEINEKHLTANYEPVDTSPKTKAGNSLEAQYTDRGFIHNRKKGMFYYEP